MGLHFTLCSALIFFLATTTFQRALAAEAVFPLLPGLEGAVEFWKQIFTRYGATRGGLFRSLRSR